MISHTISMYDIFRHHISSYDDNKNSTQISNTISHTISYTISYMISIAIVLISSVSPQVAAAERKLKHKLYPVNAMLEIEHCDTLQAAPKEELHQMLIGFYGEHVVPATFYEIKETLRRPDLVLSRTRDGAVSRYAVPDEMLKGAFVRLRDRLTACGSSDLMIQVSPEYGSHFLAMYTEPDVKHLTGERVKLLMLSLPFLLRDLIKPEVRSALKNISYPISYAISCAISYMISTEAMFGAYAL